MLCTTCDRFMVSCASADTSGVSTDKAFIQAEHGKHACDMDWRLGEEKFICKFHDCSF